MSRRSRRYENRQAKRLANKLKRFESIGTPESVYRFHDMYYYGKQCCKGVRWKQSTQNFERHLISITAVNVKKCLSNTWKPGKYKKFSIFERGKTRKIEAPFIKDRQVQKLVTNKILLPSYLPSMIYNNGASLKGKGLEFSHKQLKKHLVSHYRKHGTDGYVLLIDFKDFFGSAPHEDVLKRHRRYIPANLKEIPDKIITSLNRRNGLPLGVEPSQAEMVSFPSSLDNYIQCQLSLGRSGHYMDDYYVLIPPEVDAEFVKSKIVEKIRENGLTVNVSKTKSQPLSKPFKFCKTSYSYSDTGKIITRKNTDSLKRCKRKLSKIHSKIQNGSSTYSEAWPVFESTKTYYSKTNNHSSSTKLYSFFQGLFGFEPKGYDCFKVRDTVKEFS